MSGTKTFTLRETVERIRQQRESAEQRERAIQQRIAQLRTGIYANSAQIPVELLAIDPVEVTANNGLAAQTDIQRRIEGLKERIPAIELEYQALIAQNILDESTLRTALQKTRQELAAENLERAEAHLQALDNLRIEITRKLQSRWLEQLPYLQERLDALSDRLPRVVTLELQADLQNVREKESLTDVDIETLHGRISEWEAQTERVREIADNLVASWQKAGYEDARVIGIDDGDVVIEVETHEGVNSQMRVQFDSQQLDLFGPPEETSSCATRTRIALQLFQQQGYRLEWTTLDGQPVPEEWRQLGDTLPDVETEENGRVAETAHSDYPKKSSTRRRESQGY